MDRRDQMERLDKVRQGMKMADYLEFRMPISEDFFDRMHDKIMAKVKKTEIQPANLNAQISESMPRSALYGESFVSTPGY